MTTSTATKPTFYVVVLLRHKLDTGTALYCADTEDEAKTVCGYGDSRGRRIVRVGCCPECGKADRHDFRCGMGHYSERRSPRSF